MKKRTVILCVTNDLISDQRVQKVAFSLKKLGLDVSCIGRNYPSSTQCIDPDIQFLYLKCRINKGKLFYIEYNIRLFLHLIWHKYDIVTANDMDTLPACSLSGFFYPRRYLVFDAHEYFEEVPEVTNRHLVKSIWNLIGKLFIRKADACMTVNESLAKIFAEKYHKKFYVIRNTPIPIIKTPEPPLMGLPYLLYQGALNEGRGVTEMIMAMERLPQFNLLIAGIGDIEEDLKKQAAAGSAKSRIHFLGRLTPENLRNITAGAYIGINILEAKGLNYYYSLANKFFDYVQAGVPSINMDWPEYRIHNAEFEVAVLIPDIKAQTLVAAILALYNDLNDHQKLRMNCFKAAKTWSWDHEEIKLKSVYGISSSLKL